jgi:endo-1,4-beta-xylanase
MKKVTGMALLIAVFFAYQNCGQAFRSLGQNGLASSRNGLENELATPESESVESENSEPENVDPEMVLTCDQGFSKVGGECLFQIAPDSLRAKSELIDFDFGSNINRGLLTAAETHRQYLNVLKNQYSILTPENAMKWGPLRPSRNSFNFGPVNQIMDFAQKHQQKIHGHTLVWHLANPQWLVNGSFTPAEKESLLREHIRTVIQYFNINYPGQIVRWDVVNEAFESDYRSQQLRTTLWSDIGNAPADYIRLAFREVRAHAPQATLIYNDFSIETVNPKSTAVLDSLTRLRGEGVPIDAVGLQVHYSADYEAPSVAQFKENMIRFAQAGLEIYITELDVRYNATDGFSPFERRRAIDVYNNLSQACGETPMCRGLTTWGIVPVHSWIPQYFGGYGAFLPFDNQYQPTEAYQALENHF